jgi:nitrite reductase (NADH) small subunit
MPSYPVARISEFEEAKPIMFELGKLVIGVYKYRGKFYAYENICPHQGGPVCEGVVTGRMEARMSATGRYIEDYVSDERMVIACPWHGSEYAIETGYFDDKLSLTSFPIIVENGEVKVEVPDSARMQMP